MANCASENCFSYMKRWDFSTARWNTTYSQPKLQKGWIKSPLRSTISEEKKNCRELVFHDMLEAWVWWERCAFSHSFYIHMNTYDVPSESLRKKIMSEKEGRKRNNMQSSPHIYVIRRPSESMIFLWVSHYRLPKPNSGDSTPSLCSKGLNHKAAKRPEGDVTNWGQLSSVQFVQSITLHQCTLVLIATS